MSANSFLRELQRRNVHRAAMFYAAAAWLLVQVATQVFPFFDIPNSTVRIVVIAVVIGFPFAMLFSWFYEWTPQGIKLESEIDRSESVTRQTGKTLDRWIIAVLSLAVIVLLANTFVLRDATNPAADRNSGSYDKSIAVLPFDNLSRDPDNAYFATGIQDEILTRLSKISALKVISRTSTMRIASKPENLPELARLLGVSAILEGSVQKAGDTVHINVQLIRAATDEHLWAESYNRKLDDVFAVQGEVAQAVADALSATLTGAERQLVAAKPTTNAKAYEFYLRGLAMEGRFTSLGNEISARAAAYQSAVDLDPQFAVAWARLAAAHTELYFNEQRTPQLLKKIEYALDQATRLAPQTSETWEALGLYRYYVLGDYDAAFAAYAKARETRPSDGSLVYPQGNIRRRQGRWEEALALQTRAAELDPLSTNTWINIGITLRGLRRYDEAQAALDRGLAAAPGDTELLTQKIFTYLASGQLDAADRLFAQLPPGPLPFILAGARYQTFLLKRDYAGGIALVQQVLQHREAFQPWELAQIDCGLGELERYAGAREAGLKHLTECRDQFVAILDSGDSTPWNYPPLSRAAALLGDRAAAARYAELGVKTLANDAIGNPIAAEAQALVLLQAGDKAQAIARLRDALGRPNPNGSSLAIVRLDPLWDPLRAEPAFKQLLSEPAP
ncbi:tetratricopeptide repeat protein [uncultured Nevskia sp.]|uniref:tetratricopeptide repeat protein n=1 Tax=uncultured Nevskia sp. TaxID=228950 RepID=UPI0025E181A9|nr:tetratricopeptide repeat protein [uncultured Nevskia sp.]